MKRLKKDISFLLIIALVVTSFALGVGQLKSSAYTDAAGTGMFKVDIVVETNGCGPDYCGTDSSFRLQFLNASGGVVAATPDNALSGAYGAGNGGTNPLEQSRITTFTWNGSGGGDVACTVPSLAALAVNKTITQVQLVNTAWVDNWYFKNIIIYYSYDGSNWVTIANNAWDNYSTRLATATWNVSWFTNNTKTLTFNANGGIGGGTYDAIPGQTITAPANPERTGYTFAGWSYSVPARMLNSNTTYTAQWTPNTYTVNYEGNGSTGGTTASSSHIYDAAKTLTPNGFTKTGNYFIGWAASADGPVLYSDSQSASNLSATNGAAVTLYAKWQENPTITFNTNGGSAVEAITSEYNASISKPANPVKDGCNFGEWYWEPECITPVIWPFTVEQNTTFYAKWNVENSYTINFNANGGTGSTNAAMSAGDPLTAPAVTRTGYTFAGWLPIVPSTVPAENTFYTAQWAANTYSVNYIGNGNNAGSTASSLHTYDVASALTSNGFIKTGNSFIGWSTDQSATATAFTNGQSVLNLTPNQGGVITFYAVWSINYYTIAFNANGGTGGTSASKQYGTALTAPTVTRTGYAFASWSPEVPATVPAANSTYTAQWTTNQYLVTFDAQGGSVSPASSTVTYGSTYGAGTGGFPTPTRTDYIFDGWYTGTGGTGTKKLSTTTVSTSAAHTLYAKWIGFTYTVSNDQATITGYNGTGSQVTIPSVLGGYPVTTIGNSAFYANRNTLTSVVIPDSVITIGYQAFRSCGLLTNVTLGNSVTTIDVYAFYVCDLRVINFPNSLKSIGENAFRSNYNLTSVSFPAGLTDIGNYAFGYCYALTQISIPDSVVSIGEGAFYNCREAISVNIGSGLSSLGSEAFAQCLELTQITVDGQNGQFSDLGGVLFNKDRTVLIYYPIGKTGTYNIPSGVETISDYAFSLSTLTAVTLPNSLKTIGIKAFSSCDMTSITIPEGVTSIGQEAFIWCGALTSAYFMGDAPTTFGADVFDSCASGFKVYYLPDKTGFTSPTWNTYPSAVFTAGSVTVTFNANGGTGGTSTLMAIASALTAPAVTRTGYTFTGWSPAVPPTVPEVNTTYTAQWTAITYTVTYDGNLYTFGSTASSTHTYGITKALTANGFTRTGYSFTGWGTSITGPLVYPDKQSVTNLTATNGANVILYAKWGEKVYVVNFDAQGGSVSPTNKNVTYSSVYGTLPAPTRTGYTFGGWYTGTGGTGTNIISSTTVTITTPQTLYAKWTASDSVTITFDANGGTGGTSIPMTVGAALLAPAVTRTGYLFTGWSPAVPPVVPDVNTTYTAQWVASTPNSDFTYTVANGQATVTKYNGTSGNVVIPDTLDGYPVTGIKGYKSSSSVFSIYRGIFYECIAPTAVTIPATVTSIGDYAFKDCSKVTAVNIPDSVTAIGIQAFSHCTGLTNIMIADSVTVLGSKAFEYCSGLTGATIGNGVVSLNNSQFSDCSKLTSLSIGRGLAAFNTNSLGYCFKLAQITVNSQNNYFTAEDDVLFDKLKTTLLFCPTTKTGDYVIPDGVAAVGAYAFGQCKLLTSITLPASMTTVASDSFRFTDLLNSYIVSSGNTAFSSQDGMLFNNSLTAIIQCPDNKAGNYVIPGTVTEIRANAFNDCTKLTGVVIPNSVITISDYAFRSCRNLGSLFIPNSVTSIGDQAFAGCSGLTSLMLGSGLTAIGQYAFVDCEKLTSVTIPGSAKNLSAAVFAGCDNLANVTIESGVTQISNTMFSNCRKLTSVSLPNTVKTIDSGAFQSCISLASITLPSSIISIKSGAFSSDTVLAAAYFMGNAPTMETNVFKNCASGFTIYHLADKSGFSTPTWYGYPTATFSSEYTITFNADGGTGGTSGLMPAFSALTAPTVSKDGFMFAGWSPAVPATVPARDTVYTAQYYLMPAVTVTKLAAGFKVNIKDWAADYKYQIWSSQKFTDDMFEGGSGSQWVLSQAYTVGSSGTAEPDGSISFTIADFISPDSNYTIAVRITNASGNYLGEIRDSYTPEDVSEVKIAKVLVDGEYSSGCEIREIKAGAAMTFAVIGNNVPGTVFTAQVLEGGTVLTANSAVEFGWDISTLTPGTYAVQFTASNGATIDTKNITVQLYSLDTGIQYGAISELGLTAIEDNTLPKALTIDPDFTNGSFYYRVGEPGRKAIFTSGLFDPADSIEYTFTKYGIYQVSGFVNREYEVRIGSNFDDGYIKQFVVSRSQTEPSTATLTAGSIDLSNPIQKLTEIRFEADAQIGGIGSTPVQYSFWRYDAKGYALVKDWSSDNTLDWTPARVGHYTIEVRAKGADAGSYEVAKSVKVTVTDGTDQIAQGVVITLNEAELNANATARAPITVKANATSSNSEDLLYKFYVSDAAMGTSTLQAYSADSNCIWTPRKAGTYTISVLMKNNASYGAYDAMESFEITVS